PLNQKVQGNDPVSLARWVSLRGRRARHKQSKNGMEGSSRLSSRSNGKPTVPLKMLTDFLNKHGWLKQMKLCPKANQWYDFREKG
uniref:Uncharacterized protein n=1 Tax=Romanomermis culicivorax TaxID=13658 RepID=A0A915I760_ROMCU